MRDAQGRPRDEILYHVGRAEALGEDQLRRLVRSIGRFLAPDERTRLGAELEGLGSDLRVAQSVAFGGAHVLDRLWRRLGLDRVVGGRTGRWQRRRAAAVRHGRQSRAGTALQAGAGALGRAKVAIPGLAAVAVHHLYRAMDFLVEHGEALQQAVFFSTASLLNLEVDLWFLDPTSVYVEIEDEDDDGLRRFGHSKDRRPDRPQVVVALAVTRAGLPVRCWTLLGNTADAAIVADVQRDLAGWRLNRVVWVMDRGMAGRRQRAALQRGGGHVIVGAKLRAGSTEAAAVLRRPGRYRRVRDNLEAKELTLERGSERRRFVLVATPTRRCATAPSAKPCARGSRPSSPT